MNALPPPRRYGPPAGHRFDTLIANGQAHQWSMDEDIDWHQEIIPPGWLPRRFRGALISQFLHGEEATARVCRRLMAEASDPTVRELLAVQIADENRHARVYEKYLARLGDWAPMNRPWQMPSSAPCNGAARRSAWSSHSIFSWKGRRSGPCRTWRWSSPAPCSARSTA